MKNHIATLPLSEGHFLSRLLRDKAGNTLAMIAAAILPVMALMGGGLDMGRAYLAQSRLQQACDAGVLAARKRLGTNDIGSSTSSTTEESATMAMARASMDTSSLSSQVNEIGQRFFNINFRDGSYGTTNRNFVMTLEDDYSLHGDAEVDVPTTIMGLFGFDTVEVKVDCMAQTNMQNTDVMMVLDVTSSMNYRNPDDTISRLDALRSTIRKFYTDLETARAAGGEIRYGFVPFSTNVNVGHLLKDEWVVDEWEYQSRKLVLGNTSTTTETFTTYSDTLSGSYNTVVESQYKELKDADGNKYCDPPTGVNTYKYSGVVTNTVTEEVVGPPAGTKTTETIQGTYTGTYYYVVHADKMCTVYKRTYEDYQIEYFRITMPVYDSRAIWSYRPVKYDVTDWRTTSNGCIEERETYEIDDFNNVDLNKALDLNIDLVPELGKEKTQWRPQYPGLIFARKIKWDYSGDYSPKNVLSFSEFVMPSLAGLAFCPAKARKLDTMTAEELDSYLSSLVAKGSTYHDIGMIWGARLLSPTGIFKDENGGTRSRHLIYLTDGYTYGLDLSYSSYGQEPLDQRRWSSSSPISLTETIEKRFSFACEEAKKKNITVWIISFGIEPTESMVNCAGPGHYFYAKDANELNISFGKIAKTVSELRLID
ncbi:MAG: Tad domain-containing protein [Sphingomonadaceae bacterium]|nr:Tad domain-containing protein [Sphingomonadaceae bacterium]